MPPEPSPWDRRAFRKHERSGGSDPRFAAASFTGGGSQRWRDHHHPHAPPPYHHQNRHHQQRWCSDFRSSRHIPPGHGKQGGWHMYSDEPGHGYLPFGYRYGDRNFEDENSRPFASRGEGRYFRNANARENRGWRGRSWEPTTSPSGGGKPTAEVNNRKSVERTQTPQNNIRSTGTDSSHPPEFANPLTRSQTQSPSRCILKEQQHKDGGTAEETTSPSQKVEKEKGPVSIDWKPLKWHRSGSLSSRGSGFSHSSSPKSMGVDSIETVAAVQPKNPTPLQSPLADTAIRVSPGGSAPLDDSCLRKKPRLGWGEGLAKFEKKKVEGPEDCGIKDGEVVSIDNTETLQSHAVNFIDKCPRVICLPDCASPATPSSVACSYSTGVEEKESIRSVNINNDAIKLSCSPITVAQALYSGPTFNLENLKPSSIANLSTLINEMLHSCGPSATDSGYMQSSLLNKVLVLKVDISKAIEVTESELDSLETELKLLIAESRTSPYPASSSSLPGDCHLKPCEDQEGVEGSLDLDVNNSNNSNEKFLDNGEEVNACSVEPSTVNSSKVLATGSNMCFDVNDHCSIIWASNKDCANRAMEELYKVLPAKMYQFDISIATGASSLNGNSSLVNEKFIKRKRFLQLKEKVLSLKFKVFRHFWKEGRVLSVRKLRLKAHKKFDLSGHKKNRSIRPRISFFSGTPQTVPADEVIEFVNSLLSRIPFKPCRNTLKMPSLILDKEEMNVSRFTSDNGLIIDPRAVEKERSTINPWTSEETEIFIDNLAAFGKDFKKISYFLEHKTIADCIQFYYKNHKSELFVRAKKKKPDSTKQRKPQSTTYLVASTKRWNRETNAASLDMLGAASAIVANVNDNGTEILKKCTSKFFFSPSTSYKSSKDEEDSERETVAADVLAGICGSISSEAMSSCITSSVDHGDGYYQDWRYQRVGSSKKRALTPDVTQRSIDDDCSDESCDEMGPTDWTDEEKSAFVQAVSSYGKDFVMISQFVGTKSREHCKVYFSKARKSLGLDLIQPESGDVNGGGSDIEDACDAETVSIICKEGTDNSNPEFKICEENNRPRENDSMAAERIIKDLPLCHSMRGDKVVEDLNMEDKEQNDVKFSYEAKKGDSGGVSEGSGREESEGRLILSPKENLNGEKVEDVNSSEASAVSCTLNEMKSDDPCVSHPSIAANSVIQIGKVSECQKKTDLGSEKSPVVPLRENDQLPSVNSSTLFSVPIKYQRSPSHNALSASGNNMICYKRSNNIVRANDHQKNLSGYAVSDPAEIFSGYPVSVQSKKQINSDLNCKRSIPLQSVPKRNEILHSDRFSLQKCSSSDHLRPQSSGSSDVDRPHRNGDVKLFGKILTSSHPKPNCSEEQDGQLCKPGQSLNVKFNGGHKVNSNSAQSKFDCSNYSGSENFPVNNCGFWDGNRIQTGFSQLPDSALLLTKYPAAFGNYTMHALNLDQPSIPSNSNGVTEYQVLRNQQTDVLFSEMQRRIGLDVISGIQQQARGINVVGGRGVLASGVSDPVAAIKMHYEQFSLQSGNILKEDDSRRSNGDLGR